MKIYTKKNKLVIFAFVSFLVLSTCIIPITAYQNNYDNETGLRNKNIDTSSQDMGEQGQQHTNQNDDIKNENDEKNQHQQHNNSIDDQNEEVDTEQNQGDEKKHQEHDQYQKQYHKSDDDGDDVDDEKERYHGRIMSLEHASNRSRIRSEWQQQNDHDIFDIVITTDNGLTISFDYGPKNNLSNSHSNFSFQISFTGLIEYNDSNMNGRYDIEDNIVSSYNLTDATFIDLEYDTEISSDGEPVTLIQTRTTDSIFAIVLYISGNYSQIQNQTISPSEMKMDFIITNYNYNDNASFIALETELQTVHAIEIESETFDEKQGFSHQEHEINISSKHTSGFFSWLETALVDGVESKVNVTVYSSIKQTITEEEKQTAKSSMIYFSYPQGERIVHDPKIGVVSLSFSTYASAGLEEMISSNNIFVFIGICLFASVLFIGIVFIRKRL